MTWLIQALGKLVGIYFTPDNHTTPILRLGRYHRVKGPGLLWIIPFFEKVLPPVKTSIHVGTFFFEEVQSQDNIPFTIQITVLFTFQPDRARKAAAAQLVKGGDALFNTIVKDYTNQGLRRLVAKYEAETLSNQQTMTIIEYNLVHYLTATMRVLGLAPLKNDGILIKEVIGPKAFKETMLNVKHNEALREVLRNCPTPEFVQLFNQLSFINSLQNRTGQIALMMGSPESAHMLPMLGQPHTNGQNGNGH